MPPPPPPSDLLSRLDAFLPQLAKANQDLLSKTTPTDGKDMEVEESNGDNGGGDDGAGGVAAAASSCASASAAAAVASLQIDADMVQCGDSSDSDSNDSSSDDSDSGSDSDSDEDDDEAEKGGPPTIEMSIALGPFGDGGMSDDAGALVNIGSGNMEDIAEDSDSKHCPKPEQQPKKRKVLIEEISS